MKIINLTPHPIHIMDDSKKVLKTYPSEGLIRLQAHSVNAGITIEGIPITITEFGKPQYFTKKGKEETFPQIQSHVFYIVSQLVKSALKDRFDLLVPAEVIRDNNGNILGCKSLGI